MLDKRQSKYTQMNRSRGFGSFAEEPASELDAACQSMGSDTTTATAWCESRRTFINACDMYRSEWKSNIEWRTNHIQKMSIGHVKCRIPFEEWFDSDWLPSSCSRDGSNASCSWCGTMSSSTTTSIQVASTNGTSDDNECEMKNNNECNGPPNEKNENVEIRLMLGKGGFGNVYVGTMDGIAVAVKVMVVEESQMERAIREADIGCHLRHPNIVQTLKYKISDALSDVAQLKGLNPMREEEKNHITYDDDPLFEIWIVQELCTMDTLHVAIKKGTCFMSNNKFTKLEIIVLLTLDIVEALLYLNKHGIIHGDLSSSNVMLTEDASTPLGSRAKVVDFGRAKLCQSEKVKTDTLGTIVSMAPETVLSGELSIKSDIYSLGIILIELWSGKIPWSDRLTVQILFAVSQGKEVDFPDNAPLQLKELGLKCLNRYPDQRPSPQEVKNICLQMIDSDVARRHCQAL